MSDPRLLVPGIMLHVVGLSAKGVQVVTLSSTEAERAFWLPRHRHVEWHVGPFIDSIAVATVPDWLVTKHRQLMAAEEYQRVKDSISERIWKMKQQQDAGRGALFKNDRKQEGSQQPDFKGDITISGKKFWLSGWVKEGAKGKYFSLAARPADEADGTRTDDSARRDHQAPPASTTPKQQAPRRSFDKALEDEIPFAPEVR